LFLPIAGVTVLLILGGTAYKSAQLRQGGRVVAEGLGGRPVLPGTGDLKERQLLNVVEEMAIASGTPVPLVYVMDEETGINAFAAGTEPSNAVIGVTRGCIELLSRSELQGVIAHEFSHIRNGDMRLNMRLIGFIFGILILMIVGRVLLSSMRYVRTSRDSKGGNGILLAVLLVGLVLFLVGAVGGFFARLIQAAVSRQREFLADASAVQFTRDPGGLTGALKKIGGWEDHSRVKNPQGSAVSHMFFAEGGLFRWGLATHPPLQVRIRALDPAWTQKFDSVSLPAVEMEGSDGSASGAVANLAPSAAAPARSTMNAVETLGHLGDQEGWQLSSGLRVCSEIDQRWRKASQDRRQAQILIFAMLLSRDLQQRRVQVEGPFTRKGTRQVCS
ncbi:MAG: M48 family metallopeptidase, partial [Verrucomicrobiota bacterium]|nr:M48 family metallopeptidase [Verrucomicrobiota bacterium]